MAERRDDHNDLRMAPIVLGVLGLMFVIGVAGQVVGQYLARAPGSPAPVATKTDAEAVQAAKPAAAKSGPAKPAAVAAASSLSLPGGGTLQAAADGVESKLLGFINDANAVIDKKTWFDFDRLNFETGSANLTADSKAQVDNIAAILKAHPSTRIKIGGYTDNTGDAEANLKLSDARAKAVTAALEATGIAADRLEAEGYGDQHPIADNATADGRAKNRRIAVSVRAK